MSNIDWVFILLIIYSEHGYELINILLLNFLIYSLLIQVNITKTIATIYIYI